MTAVNFQRNEDLVERLRNEYWCMAGHLFAWSPLLKTATSRVKYCPTHKGLRLWNGMRNGECVTKYAGARRPIEVHHTEATPCEHTPHGFVMYDWDGQTDVHQLLGAIRPGYQRRNRTPQITLRSRRAMTLDWLIGFATSENVFRLTAFTIGIILGIVMGIIVWEGQEK